VAQEVIDRNKGGMSREIETMLKILKMEPIFLMLK
jgi:hypothetical protein